MLHERDVLLDPEFSWIFIVVDVIELPNSLPSHSPKHQCAINTIYVSQPLMRLNVIINQLEHYIHAMGKINININNSNKKTSLYNFKHAHVCARKRFYFFFLNKH